MKLRVLALAAPFVLAAGLGISQAGTTAGNPLTPVLVDTATVTPAADGSVNVPGVVSAVVLPSAANQVRLGSVKLNGVAILDAASLDCTGAHPALLLAPTAGVVLPSVPSVGTMVTVPGVGPLTLNGEQPGNGVAYVTGISALVDGHTVNLLNGTCAESTQTITVGGTPAGTGSADGPVGVSVSITGKPTATPPPGSSRAAVPTATPAASPGAANPADAPATLPARTPPGPGEAAAPSPVPGAGGVTG